MSSTSVIESGQPAGSAGGPELVELLRAAGLDGRGGAGFATATKIAQARGADLIVNGCDGELGSAKDTAVLTHRLDEVCRATQLIAPRSTRFAVHRGGDLAARLRRAGLDVLETPRRYVSSEASALVSLAQGGDARPLTKRTHLAQGLIDLNGRRLPRTLVLNAETLLRVDQIVQHGPTWFRSFGTATDPGPRLVSINGAVTRPGVYESAAGVPLAELVASSGSARAHVHAGGLAGGWVRDRDVEHTLWSREGLRARGAALGAATLTLVGVEDCPLAYASRLVDYASGESAGQCGPCMFALPAMADDLRDVIGGDSRANARLNDRLARLNGRGACHFPDGVAAFIGSTLNTFADVILAHVHGTCRLHHDVPAESGAAQR